MTESADLIDQTLHFAFGKNWASSAKPVAESLTDEAIAGMRRAVRNAAVNLEPGGRFALARFAILVCLACRQAEGQS